LKILSQPPDARVTLAGNFVPVVIEQHQKALRIVGEMMVCQEKLGQDHRGLRYTTHTDTSSADALKSSSQFEVVEGCGSAARNFGRISEERNDILGVGIGTSSTSAWLERSLFLGAGPPGLVLAMVFVLFVIERPREMA
jgi:hypothetical protein